MTILLDVLKELFSMFVADFRLTLATLALVAAVALLIARVHVDPATAGWLLLTGCLMILITAVLREAHVRRRGPAS